MAKIVKLEIQAKAEIKAYYIDYSDALPTAGTVASASAAHIPPSGSASTPTVSIQTPIVAVVLGPLTVKGTHMVDILATFSDGEKSAVRLIIPVNY